MPPNQQLTLYIKHNLLKALKLTSMFAINKTKYVNITSNSFYKSNKNNTQQYDDVIIENIYSDENSFINLCFINNEIFIVEHTGDAKYTMKVQLENENEFIINCDPENPSSHKIIAKIGKSTTKLMSCKYFAKSLSGKNNQYSDFTLQYKYCESAKTANIENGSALHIAGLILNELINDSKRGDNIGGFSIKNMDKKIIKGMSRAANVIEKAANTAVKVAVAAQSIAASVDKIDQTSKKIKINKKT